MSSIEFVEVTWEKQARLHTEKTPLGDEAFYALFSGEMQKLMRAPRTMPANAPIGPLLNAFFGYGVLPGTEVEIGKIAPVSGKDGGPAMIRVTVKHHGERRNIQYMFWSAYAGWARSYENREAARLSSLFAAIGG